MTVNIAQANDAPQINKLYAEQNLTPLYQVGKGGEHDGLTVLRRRSSRGNATVAVVKPNGEEWKLSRLWNNRTMRFAYSVERTKKAPVAEPASLVWDVATFDAHQPAEVA